MKDKTKLGSGFTLIEIMIVVAIIGLLAAIAIPNFVKARSVSQQNACINNLRYIDSAKQQWALETRQATNTTPGFSDISGYLRISALCPAAGSLTAFSSSYTMNDVGSKPQCAVVGDTSLNPHVLTDTTN
jgi:prepilin-type N-terminal cleavage/methylation domain-containing protein